MLIEMIRTFILGIVEGITEWLPISSTGHLILVNELLQNKDAFTNSDLYLYVIQLGAILAVVTLFFKQLNPFAPSKSAAQKKGTWELWAKIVVGTIPAGVIGLILDSYMEKLENWITVSITLIIYGIAFLLIERKNKKLSCESISTLSYKTAILIGCFQVLAVVPGTSRSGATILGGMLLGCSRTVAAEYGFFLSIPIMFGISFIKILKFVLDNGQMNGADITVLLTGMAVAYIVSLVTIKMLMNFVKNHSFKSFGIYRIILGAVVIAFFGIKYFC